jgi:hypothetical protein
MGSYSLLDVCTVRNDKRLWAKVAIGEGKWIQRDCSIIIAMQPDQPTPEPLQNQLVDSTIARHVQALKDSDVDVCRHAAESLVLLGAEAIPALIQVLKDGDWEVRWLAAEALGKIGDDQAVPALIETLTDNVKEVRWLAVAALSKLGDVPALALKILADIHTTPFQKLRSLVILWSIRPQPGLRVRYTLRPVLQYCTRLLERDEVDQEAKEGARAVLMELKKLADEKTLMRAADRDLTTVQDELLRAVSPAQSSSAPDELVRASELPEVKLPQRPSLKDRLHAFRDRFHRQK